MWSVFLDAIVTVLVIYAVIDILQKVITAVFRKKPYGDDDVFVVIKVKNQEKNIEYVIRSIIWKNLNLNSAGRIPNILIVDMGSDDETEIIAKKLCEDYSFIYFTTEEQYRGMKNEFFR